MLPPHRFLPYILLNVYTCITAVASSPSKPLLDAPCSLEFQESIIEDGAAKLGFVPIHHLHPFSCIRELFNYLGRRSIGGFSSRIVLCRYWGSCDPSDPKLDTGDKTQPKLDSGQLPACL
ncbi:hypothetical protein F5B20DRAFT_74059 [Whalleya microplaca]|nr:hypothetical protein F5B20DRAFT_74059 [Whalleya microplaca]